MAVAKVSRLGQSRELYYRARTIDAEELKLGLVNEVVPADSLMDTAMTWAQKWPITRQWRFRPPSG